VRALEVLVDGRGRELEAPRDVRDRRAVEVAQQHDVALTRGEREDRGGEPLLDLGAGRELVGGRLVIARTRNVAVGGPRARMGELAGRAGGARAVALDADVAQHAREPTASMHDRTGPRRERAHVGLLHEVLGVVARTRERPREAPRPRVLGKE
jgi:hypothetical protein